MELANGDFMLHQVCVFILLYCSMLYCMCPHATRCVMLPDVLLYCMCPHAARCVLILLYISMQICRDYKALIYTFTHKHTHTLTHTHTNTYMCVCVYVCMYVCMSACMHACMYVCMYACMYVCMHVCMHVCMYVCMHGMYVCICRSGAATRRCGSTRSQYTLLVYKALSY